MPIELNRECSPGFFLNGSVVCKRAQRKRRIEERRDNFKREEDKTSHMFAREDSVEALSI